MHPRPVTKTQTILWNSFGVWPSPSPTLTDSRIGDQVMTLLKTFTLGILVGFTLSACGDSTLDQIEEAKDKVCACKDRACARAVAKESKHLKDKAKEMINEDKLKAMKFADQAKACVSKLKS